MANRRAIGCLKWLGGILGLFILIGFILYMVFNEAKPTGKTGPEAEALAQKMLAAVDKSAWDSTNIVQWTFRGAHTFLWDKKRHLVQVTWDDKKVLLNPNEISGKAYIGGNPVAEPENDQLVKQAWGYFCNDSFWLNAPVKAFDPGTERSIVTLDDGSEALMVSYASGGVTPGDSYLWILDENAQPKSWKMWVKIIPFGGLEFSWEKWDKLASGAKIATFHHSSILDIDISNLQSGANFQSLGITDDPFAAISK